MSDTKTKQNNGKTTASGRTAEPAHVRNSAQAQAARERAAAGKTPPAGGAVRRTAEPAHVRNSAQAQAGRERAAAGKTQPAGGAVRRTAEPAHVRNSAQAQAARERAAAGKTAAGTAARRPGEAAHVRNSAQAQASRERAAAVRTAGSAARRPGEPAHVRNSAQAQAARERAATAGKTTTAGRRPTATNSGGGNDKNGVFLVIGGIVLLALVIVIAIFALTKKPAEQQESESAVETTAFDPNVIQTDLYVDASALCAEGGGLINLKGMNREQALAAIIEGYSWDLRVQNTNPNLDQFEMPSLPEAVPETSTAAEGDAAEADNEGTVQEVAVDDPFANITIRPSATEFAVPDLLAEHIRGYVEQIFADYETKGNAQAAESSETEAEKTEAEGESTAESSAEAADYVLTMPDVRAQLTDYAAQLGVLWNMKPKNGEISSYDKESGKFVFGGSVNGYTLDEGKLVADLTAAVNEKNFTAQIEAGGSVIEASNEDASSRYKTIGSYTTKTTSNSVRNKNIELSCRAINGYVLQPGEEFSFNQVVGERTEAKGYGAAAAYNNGEVVQEVGGGVCQTSTTLYNAVFRAGLTTTYRRSHTFEPSYVTPGMDATVSWGGPDYRFVNNTGHAIGIRASYGDRTCTISIYGIPVLPEGVTWELESKKVRGDIEPPTSIIESGSPSNGSYGSEWQVYKVVKKNGEVVERVKDHYASYKGHTKLVLSDSAQQATTAAAATTAATTAAPTESSADIPMISETTTEAVPQLGPNGGPGVGPGEAPVVPQTTEAAATQGPAAPAPTKAPETAAPAPTPVPTTEAPPAPVAPDGPVSDGPGGGDSAPVEVSPVIAPGL